VDNFSIFPVNSKIKKKIFFIINKFSKSSKSKGIKKEIKEIKEFAVTLELIKIKKN